MKKEKGNTKNNVNENLIEEELQAKNGENPAAKEGENQDKEEKNNGEVDLEQELQSEIEGVDKIKNELEEIKDKYLRLYSEFDNFRRRTAKERLELVKTANEDLMTTLLPVIDDFERAQKAAENKENSEAALQGYDLIYNKFLKVLGQKGLENMGVAKGSDFNPELHDAITQIPTSDDLKGKVVDVIEQGYYLGEKVIRYAKVVIGA